MYLLDANACIRILNKTSLPLIERLAQHEPSEIWLSSVVKAELLFGARRSERVQDNLELLARFFAYDLTLVSHNVNEFSRVHGLRVEDWEVGTTPNLGG